jgi:hypothetical protein
VNHSPHDEEDTNTRCRCWAPRGPKHDRPSERLLLRGLTVKDGVPPAEAAAATAAAAQLLTTRLGLAEVETGEAVPAALAAPLRAAVAEAEVPRPGP